MLLKRRSLEIYHKNSDNVMDIEFDSSAIRHLEVVNRDEVIKTLVDSFKSLHLKKQSAVIALSDHIVFEKLITNQDPAEAKRETLNFFHNVPLDEKNIAKKLIPLKGTVLALGANRELYRIILEVAREFEWKIKAVVPMTLFSKTEEETKLSQDQVNHILNADKDLEESNFLNETAIAQEVKPEEKKDDEDDADSSERKTSPLVTVIIALFLVGLIIASLLYFKIISLPFGSNITSSPAPAVSRVPEGTISAQTAVIESTTSAEVQESSISAQEKSGTRIHVLNGSGIAGQANKLKEKLGSIGYANVIVGNIESSEASSSSITFAQNVKISVKGELNKFLDSLIGENEKLEETLSEFNVRIILGKLASPIE